ncbi:hypothetical protein [Thalassobacillus sp. CUG 92003]|uniref:hypothetical protein n=1 Tax=Thalassobacillus sp. CUG 92003 TaxID=2736641 RepID=UPI0015E780EA|nr:hypothetical protein [Thalassobacillus sp. CUG 92003]
MTEQLQPAQHQMLIDYNQLLDALSDGFAYLGENITDPAPPEADQVFRDIINALEQMNHSHDQMAVLFPGEQLERLMEDFRDLTDMLLGWYDHESNESKRQLLTSQVIPIYVSWKQQMRNFLEPYLVH